MMPGAIAAILWPWEHKPHETEEQKGSQFHIIIIEGTTESLSSDFLLQY